MSRTMSGIPPTTGDVTQAGNNVFTGTNTFNTNRPTSTITATPSSTDFITKQNGDALYGTGSGDVLAAGNNVFTGTNSFNTNRPTSTLATTPGSTDFITKQDADTLYNGQITTNTNNITTNTNNIASNTANITTNTNNIATNTANISTNTSNIATNTANISTNTSNIATNTANISTNTNDIATLDGEAVKLTGNQTIAGIKTFSSPPECSTAPTGDDQLANKSYVDNTAGTPSNMVTTDTDQTITGVKTFSSFPIKSGTGTALTPNNPPDFSTKYYVDTVGNLKLNKNSSTIALDENNRMSNVARITGEGTVEIFNRTENTGGATNNKGGLIIDSNGNVGINTFQSASSVLKCALVVDGDNTTGASTANGKIRFIKFNGGSAVSGGFSEQTSGMAIYGNGRGVFTNAIVSHEGTFAACDERIKENIRDFSATEKLKLIRPRQYEFIDKVSRGDKSEYGFVAQELEQHYPHFVNKDTYVIPNIMKTYDVSGTTIYGVNAKVNDTLKIIDKKGRDNYVNVIDTSGTTITIDKVIEDDICFVYGNQIDDFRVVDKEPIFTLTTASVLELIKQNEELDARIKTLEAQINTLL